MATATMKHRVGERGSASGTTETITANSAGSTNPRFIKGPKSMTCPYAKGAGRYLLETGTTYRWIEDFPLDAAATEPTGYTAESI